MFGMEDDPDSQFVLLEDCGHCIEASALQGWIDTNSKGDGQIKYHECPKCKAQIKNCPRMQESIKITTRKVNKIK